MNGGLGIGLYPLPADLNCRFKRSGVRTEVLGFRRSRPITYTRSSRGILLPFLIY